MTYRDTVLADSPAGYWRLGEASGTTAADETGNFPGTYTSGSNGGPTLGVAGLLTGDADTAIFIPEQTSHGWVDLGTPNSTSTLDGWTWEVWLNTGSTAESFPGIFGELSTEDPGRLLQSHQGETWTFEVRLYTGTSVSTKSVTGMPYDTTMHLVVTVEDAQTSSPTTRVYRDGTQIASWNDYGTSLTAPYRQQGLAVRDNSVNRYFGTLDEAAFYTSALSAARVQAHYDAGTSGQLSTPTGWTFVKTTDTAQVVGTWNAVTDAATYDYEVQVWSGSTWGAFASGTTTDPTTTFTLDSSDGVTFSTLYRARVRAVPA